MTNTSGAGALQFYYTSCRRGLSGYAGFQTRAESAGLQLEERRELEAKAMYQPPRDLPREPDAETIAARFPTAYRTVRLASGRFALIRAVYAGQDYSGRWGNYFAHALVLDDVGEGRWPIDAFAWQGWVSNVADDDIEPAPLPQIDSLELTTGADFSFDELKTFLNEAHGRPQALETMLRAVFRRSADSRSIVIREQLELDALYWVACIQKAFPPPGQKSLSCSTYQFDPRSSFAVNATVGDTDFLFDEGERKYQFYVFDFVTGAHSSVPEDGAEYASAVSGWMASAPERLRAFHDFASLFKDLEIDGRLLHVFRLFRLETGESVALSSADVTSILAFVRDHARPAAFSRLLSAVGYLSKTLEQGSRAEDWVAVVRFLAAGAVATGEAEHRLRACQTWLDAFDTLAIAQQSGEETVLALRGELEKQLQDGARTLSELFLSDAHMDFVLARASKLPPKTLGVTISEVDRSCRRLGPEPSHASQAAHNLIEAVVVANPQLPDLQWAFIPYRSTVADLAAVTRLIATMLIDQVRAGSWTDDQWQHASRSVGGSLAGVLATGDRALRFALIDELKAKDGYTAILHGEWEASMLRAAEKTAAHAEYERHVFTGDSKFAAEMPARMAVALLRMLPADAQRVQARKWVEAGRVRSFSDDVARSVLSLALATLTFAPEDASSDELARRVTAEVSARKLKIDPVRLDLRETAVRCLREPDGINGLRADLRSVDREAYREFVAVVLPRLLLRAATRGQHRKVVMAMTRDDSPDVFAERYCSLLFQRSHETVEAVDAAALTFWLKLEDTDSAWPQLGTLREPALDAIAARLAAMTKKKRGKIEASLRALDELKGAAGQEMLAAFLERLTRRQPSWLSRIFGASRT